MSDKSNRVLLLSDIHARDTDLPSCHGYVQSQFGMFNSILEVVENKNIDTVILLGDVSDGGFSSQLMANSFVSFFRKLASKVDLYGVIGNHYFLKQEQNPEINLYLPNLKFPLKKGMYKDLSMFIEEPIVKTPDYLDIGCMRFVFQHYEYGREDYSTIWLDATKVMHGLYHTDAILPRSTKILDGIDMSSGIHRTQDLRGIDIATVGHLHVGLGVFEVNNTIVEVPGELHFKSWQRSGTEKFKQMPVYEITETSYTKEYVEIERFPELCTFKENEKLEEEKEAKNVNKKLKEHVALPSFANFQDYLKAASLSSCYLSLMKLSASQRLSYESIGSVLSQEVDGLGTEEGLFDE